MDFRGARALIGVSVLATSLTGCGSFSASPSTSNINVGASIGANQPNDTSAAWKNLEVEGTVAEGRFTNTQSVSLDKVKKELIVRLPMPANPFLDGSVVEFPVNGMPGVSLTLEPMAEGGSALALRVPLQYVLKGVEFLPPNRLPNGDALPGVADGELPSVAVQLTQLTDIKATLYFGVTTVGIYVNTPFDPFVRLTVPIRNANNTRTWGYLSSIPAKADAEGGFYVTVALPDDIARVIDDVL